MLRKERTAEQVQRLKGRIEGAAWATGTWLSIAAIAARIIW